MSDISQPESQPAINKAVTTSDQPPVYKAVRAVGIIKPTFASGSQGPFTNKLDVLGTAFWLKDYKVLVTCGHVVQRLLSGPLELTGLLMVGNLGQYSRATIAALDFDHDLAVLRVADQLPAFIDSEAASGLELVDSYPQVGTAVAYAGFPKGIELLNSIHSPTYAEGVVGVQLREGPFRKEIQITGAVAGGYSGAPIVVKDQPMKVLGVLSSGPQDPNIFMAVSWEHIKAIAKLATS
ncbi:MAG TPA: serine protease [Acidimicrobiales bacterium]|nr:serine protease [Acidimicrobiales bacterium]